MTVEKLVTAKQVAEVLGVHEKTVRDKANRGEIPGLRIGQAWRFRLSDVDEWVTKQVTSAHHPLPSAQGA